MDQNSNSNHSNSIICSKYCNKKWHEKKPFLAERWCWYASAVSHRSISPIPDPHHLTWAPAWGPCIQIQSHKYANTQLHKCTNANIQIRKSLHRSINPIADPHHPSLGTIVVPSMYTNTITQRHKYANAQIHIYIYKKYTNNDITPSVN